MAKATDVAAGIMIVCRYEPAAVTGAEHDRIYVGGLPSQPDYMSDLDRRDMAHFGWEWEEEVRSWRRFT